MGQQGHLGGLYQLNLDSPQMRTLEGMIRIVFDRSVKEKIRVLVKR
jgi:hypothetical protein